MSRGFNSAIPSPAAAAMFSHSQPVSNAMSNTSIGKVCYKRQLFRKHNFVLHLWLHTRLLGLFLNTQIKMRVNVRYCTCACARDTGTVLKRLSGVWSCYRPDECDCACADYISHWGCWVYSADALALNVSGAHNCSDGFKGDPIRRKCWSQTYFLKKGLKQNW